MADDSSSRPYTGGEKVRVQGLVKAAQHNGKFAIVSKALTQKAAEGRIGVKLDDGTVLAVKRENLELISVPSAPAPKFREAPPRSGGSWDDIGEQQLMLALHDSERSVASQPQRTGLLAAIKHGIAHNKVTVLANPPRYDRLAVRTVEHGGTAIYTVEAGLDEWEGRGWFTTVDWDEDEIVQQQLMALDAKTFELEYAGVMKFLEGCKRLGAPRYAMRTSLDPEAKPHVIAVVEKVLADSTLRFLLAEDALERADASR